MMEKCGLKYMRNVFCVLFGIFLISCAVPSPSFAAASAWQPASNEMWIQVDKEKCRLFLFRGPGEIVRSYPIAVGVGKGSVPQKSRMELVTPEGTFRVTRILQDATQLVYDPKWFGEPGEPQKGAYGAKLISFSNNWQVAIHGTNNPKSIGKKVTHGCVRLRNRDITDLVQFVKPKMRIVIIGKGQRQIYKDAI